MTKGDGKQNKPGPAPERLKLDEDDWTEAVRKALKKGKPAEDERDADDRANDGQK